MIPGGGTIYTDDTEKLVQQKHSEFIYLYI